MKARLMATWALGCSLLAVSAGTAQMNLTLNSIRMSPGPCSCGFGLVWKLHFSSFYTEDPLQADGLFVWRPPGYATTHWAFMLLEDPSMFSSTTFAEVNLPLGDNDGNGVPDLCESGREIFASTTGTYESALLGGTLELSWRRAAGSGTGTCELFMVDGMLGRIGPFQHTFETLESNGELNYQRTANGSSGATLLQRSGYAPLQGAVQLVRDPSDPFNKLLLQAGALTNTTETLAFGETLLTRNLARPTVYLGMLKTPSGEATGWTLWISDTADSNGNGIPDLSDDLPVQPPRTPVLSVRTSGNRLELLISGDLGRAHEVQASTSLASLSWQPVSTVTLTNDPHVVELAPPAPGARFWRVKAN